MFDATEARRLYDAGKGRNEIAKALGCGFATVTRWAEREGLKFDRAATAQAVAAKVIDAKARRIAIVARLYTRAEANLARLEATEFKTLVKAAQGAERVQVLDFVPTQNERDLSQAISTVLASAARLEAVDAGNDADDAKSMLAQLGRALGIGTNEGEPNG